MPAPILSTRLVTRGYELSAGGVIPASGLLRYLEHQRWQTFDSESIIPTRRFWQLGVVRAQQVDIYEQLTVHVELEMLLWVSRVGRTSLDFSHDVLRASDGKLMAQSTATVVALDVNRVPAAVGEGARDYVVERPVVPVARPQAPPSDPHFSAPVLIRPSDHDLQQHVNHARYADLFDDLRFTADAQGALGASRFGAPLRRLSLEYQREARAGDAITGRVWRAPDDDDGLELELLRGEGDVVTRARMLVSR
jgi:acyl-CoA thioesterase FadM